MKRRHFVVVLLVLVAMMFAPNTTLAQTKKPAGKTTTAKTAPTSKAGPVAKAALLLDLNTASKADLVALPGIGQYTAGAVLSFAFRRAAAILDTNAARVLTRFFALPPEQQTSSFLWTVARQVTPSGQAHLFNQAIMDLGAMICVARTPRCSVCPLRTGCRSAREE